MKVIIKVIIEVIHSEKQHCGILPVFHSHLIGLTHSTWFVSFYITVEYHLSVGGFVTARRPKSPMTSEKNVTMEDIMVMAYQLLNSW